MRSHLFKSWPDYSGRVTGHPLRCVHHNMMMRCFNPNYPTFHHYGGRGIIVDSLFLSSRSFIGWGLQNGYNLGLELDRIDNDGPYAHYNCRFVTRSENERNKRTNVRTVSGGLAIELAEGWDIPDKLFRSRRARGWPSELAATLPPGVYMNDIERLAADGQFQTILAIFQNRALQLESKANDASNP